MDVVRFKVGDKVRRKAEEIKRGYGWRWDSEIKIIEAVPDVWGIVIEGQTFDAVRFDLAEPAAKPRPSAGEYWRQRDGQIVGPLVLQERTHYLKANGRVWYVTGCWHTNADHSMDLVEKAEICGHCHQPIAAPCVEKCE